MRLFIFLYLLTLTLYSNNVSWYGDFDKAHKQALKENKKLMVLLIKKECPSCVKSIKTTFINQPYIDKINAQFISVIITKDQKGSYPVEMLYTFIYPSLFFLDKQELFNCEPIRGDITPEKLKTHLDNCK